MLGALTMEDGAAAGDGFFLQRLLGAAVGVGLADRLQFGPGVCPAHLQRRVVVEDVVAQIL